jgi:nucleotide-binding universal stress UspA family protein
MELPKIAIKRILFATDLSQSARQAFAYAVSLAGQYNAGLVMLTVIEELEAFESRLAAYVGAEAWERIRRSGEDEARQVLIGKQREFADHKAALLQMCADARGGPSPAADDAVAVVRGKPADQIIAQAKATGCDLIVMGSQGEKPFTEAFLGSTARQVLKKAAVPVLVVRLAR